MNHAIDAYAVLTTPPGRGGIAVIALGGARAAEIIAGVFVPYRSHAEDRAGALRLGRIVDGNETLDEVVLCRIDAESGGFYELNIHGGPLVARKTLDLLGRLGAYEPQASARGRQQCQHDTPSLQLFHPAHPRWNNPAIGRELLEALPLAQSELVVAALTQQWSGGISRLAGELLSGNPQSASRNPQSALRDAAECLAGFRSLLDPPVVVVLGPPNSGKSTLVNALVGREVSIVHEQPGTTRDYVREPALMSGVPVQLTDTAGLWEQSCDIDAEAMARARREALQADLVLLAEPGGPGEIPGWLGGRKVLRLATKCDLCPPSRQHNAAVSAQTGKGLDELKRAILAALGLADIDPAAPMAFTPRQADLLARAADQPEHAPKWLDELLTGSCEKSQE